VILWKDFILDENIGPVLSPEIFEGDAPVPTSCRRKRLGSPNCQEDGRGITNEATSIVSIQETRQKQRPARMVGLSSLDSHAQTLTDEGRSDRAVSPKGELYKDLRLTRGEA
jgi:hypothetical protein